MTLILLVWKDLKVVGRYSATLHGKDVSAMAWALAGAPKNLTRYDP